MLCPRIDGILATPYLYICLLVPWHTEHCSCFTHIHCPSVVPCVPPSEKRFGKLSRISWAYSPWSDRDQWDWKGSNYYKALPLQLRNFYLYSSIIPFWVILIRFGTKCFEHCSLLGDTVTKVCTSQPKEFTWFTRPFLLVRGWGLGTRVVPLMSSAV